MQRRRGVGGNSMLGNHGCLGDEAAPVAGGEQVLRRLRARRVWRGRGEGSWRSAQHPVWLPRTEAQCLVALLSVRFPFSHDVSRVRAWLPRPLAVVHTCL